MRQSVNRKQSETRFPLSLHRASGLWCKRIRGKLKYFGRDKDVALAKWEAEKQFLLAGLPVPTQATASHSLLATERVTLETACRVLLTQKRSLIDAGRVFAANVAVLRISIRATD